MTFLTSLTSHITEIFDSSNKEHEEENKILQERHRFESFAPVRQNAKVKHFVDGQDYCWAVAEAIEGARECIMIEDWWLSPELYLRRPPAKYPEYRLDTLLKRKAEEGVKIYVVVYKEVEKALTLNSKYTKSTLQDLHENIIVQRHPDHGLGDTFFWSHHEKFVIVDNFIAFLGGIDLCYGRWDTHAHRLSDYSTEPGMELFPGQDYSDARVRDFDQVQLWDMRLIDKTTVPRMPWHDISMCVMGPPVLDIGRHFSERWNFIKHEKKFKKQNIPYLNPPLGGFSGRQRFTLPSADEDPEVQYRRFRHGTRGTDGNCRAQVLRSSADWSLAIDTEHSIQNAYIDTITRAEHFVYIENQFFITTTEKDEHFILKNLIAEAIVERIVRANDEQQKFKVIVVMPLMPAFPADISTKEASTARLVMHYQYVSICRGEKSIIGKLQSLNIDPNEYIRFYSLRSYDRINRVKMEEFLAVSAGYSQRSLAGSDVTRRYQNQQASRLGEGYNGEEEVAYTRVLDDGEANAIREGYLNRYNQDYDENIASDSIANNAMRGGDIQSEPWVEDTLRAQPRDAEAEAEEASDYVTEELYIHAKILIADDKVVIMGSANLNDRSQCGDRDSEIAMIVEDNDKIPSMMNGEEYQASRFAAVLRRKLWKEHLGLLQDSPCDNVTEDMMPLPVPNLDTTQTKEDRTVMDPLSDDTLELWNRTARTNTESFRQVFHCVPDDNVKNWDDYKAFHPDPEKIEIGHVHDPNMTVDEIRDQLSQIHGHLVEFPYHFLEEVDLQGESIPFITDVVQELYT